MPWRWQFISESTNFFNRSLRDFGTFPYVLNKVNFTLFLEDVDTTTYYQHIQFWVSAPMSTWTVLALLSTVELNVPIWTLNFSLQNPDNFRLFHLLEQPYVQKVNRISFPSTKEKFPTSLLENRSSGSQNLILPFFDSIVFILYYFSNPNRSQCSQCIEHSTV